MKINIDPSEEWKIVIEGKGFINQERLLKEIEEKEIIKIGGGKVDKQLYYVGYNRALKDVIELINKHA